MFKTYLCVLLTVFTLSPLRSVAQAPSDRWRLWAAVGVGSAENTQEGGVAVMGQLVYQKRSHFAALRGFAAVDPFGDSSVPIGDVSVLYGRARTGYLGHAAIATGLALMNAGRCASTPDPCKNAIGIPIVAEAAIHPLPVAGVGLQLFTNINRRGTIVGGIVFVQLGWMPR